MKHICLILIMMLSIMSMTAIAQDNPEYVNFSYAGSPYTTGGTNVASYKGGAMLLTDNVVTRFDGCRITEIEIANARFYNADEAPLTIFFSHDLNEMPIYSFSDYMDLDHPAEYKTYVLPQPVEIKAGKPLFCGFTVFAPAYEYGNQPVWTDGVFHTDLPGGYIAFSTTTGVPEEMEWNDEGYQSGLVCIRLKIEGEMPKNTVELKKMYLDDCVTPDSLSNALLVIQNLGVNPIHDIDVAFHVLDRTTRQHIELNDSIGYSMVAYSSAATFSVPEEGANIPVRLNIEKVNGQTPSVTAVTERTVTLHSIYKSSGYPKNMLIEEAGGRGCGSCVRGIVGLDRMMKAHSDGSFIPITAHSSGYGEETAPYNYGALWERYITHNPTCLINRNFSRIGITDPSYDNLESYYREITASPAIASIEIKGCSIDSGWLNVDSDVSFAMTEDDARYSVAYVVTEDEVGPYPQQNSYSGGSIEMDGWENLGPSVMTCFDFLARSISDFDGTPLSVPSRIIPGEKYSHSDRVSLVKVTDLSKLAVIAMVINDKTGAIENACRIEASGLDSIEDIGLDNDQPIEYYDLAGRRLSVVTSPGIYIRRQGGVATKIAIR